MAYDPGPQPLARALGQLIQLRGYARVGAQSELADVWSSLVEERLARRTRPVGVKRGVLTVHVGTAALVAELHSVHRADLIERLAERAPHFKVRDIKFRLDSSLANRS